MFTLFRRFWYDEETFWQVWQDGKPMVLRVLLAAGGLLVQQFGGSDATWWGGLLTAIVGPFTIKAGDSNAPLVAQIDALKAQVAALQQK